MSSADDFIKTLVREVVQETLAQLGAGYRPTYTTAKAGPFPPGKSRAWLLRNAKLIPGARKVGRHFLVSAEDFERWAAEQDVARIRKLAGQRATASSTEALAESFLKRAGFRSTKVSA